MLEHVPEWLGHALRGVRAGSDKLIVADPAFGGDSSSVIGLTSPAFADGGPIPSRFTADGPGVSPPLLWEAPPERTDSLALIVEDADSPSLQPLVHAVMWHIDPEDRSLAEGAIDADRSGAGRNSYRQIGWLPPDPPTGHGPHHYVFQLFALAEAIDPGDKPGRSALVKAMAGKVIGVGVLVGTYSRGEPVRVAPATARASLSRG